MTTTPADNTAWIAQARRVEALGYDDPEGPLRRWRGRRQRQALHDQRARWPTESGAATTSSDFEPYLLVGSVDQICDDLTRWREQWVSYWAVQGFEAAEAAAPIVARLAGT